MEAFHSYEQVRLFCLPYAGASQYSYQLLVSLAPEWVRIIPLDLPGRGRRITEYPLSNIQQMAEDLLEKIKHQLSGQYAFFGHSMGAVLAYLLALRISEKKLPLPTHLFCSGSPGPPSVNKDELLHRLDRQTLFARLEAYGGAPPEIIRHPEIMDFFEPVLRADLKAIEEYSYADHPPLDIPVMVFHAVDDFPEEEILSWQRVSQHEILLKRYSGGHFFVFKHADKVLAEVMGALVRSGAAMSSARKTG